MVSPPMIYNMAGHPSFAMLIQPKGNPTSSQEDREAEYVELVLQVTHRADLVPLSRGDMVRSPVSPETVQELGHTQQTTGQRKVPLQW